MNNNDVLRRLRFALDLEDALVIDMFARSGHTVGPETLAALLMKEGHVGYVACPTDWLQGFLDTLILDRRGPRTPRATDGADGDTTDVAADGAADESPADPALAPADLTNNEILKKIRVALDLKEDDVIGLIARGDGKLTRPQLRTIFRSPGHKNYRACEEETLHAFLNGLTRKLRNKKD